MEVLSYLLLGLVQGLTEFLPVSSSGHLTLGQAILGLGEEDLTFTVLVHAATALSTVVVFREDILGLARDVFVERVGRHGKGLHGLLLLSAVPAAVLGLGFKTPSVWPPQVCGRHALCHRLGLRSRNAPAGEPTPGRRARVGHWIGPSLRDSSWNFPLWVHHRGRPHARGLARETAKFSFLMALIPIGGATLLTLKDLMEQPATEAAGPWLGYAVGTVAAFASGWAACTWMIQLVKRRIWPDLAPTVWSLASSPSFLADVVVEIHLSGFGALCMLATGCISVTFPGPMPYNRKDLTSFPNAWHGIWSSHATGTDDTGEDKALVIFPDRLQGHEGDDLILGKNCVLRKWGRRHVLSIDLDDSNRKMIMVAQRRGNHLDVLSFDASQEGALTSWEDVLGSKRVTTLHKNDDPTDKVREVQLNPRSNCQFRKLVKHGSSDLVTYTRVASE